MHIELRGLVLTARPGERVDRVADCHVDKASVFDHFSPARTGQPTCNSTGPQIDIA